MAEDKEIQFNDIFNAEPGGSLEQRVAILEELMNSHSHDGRTSSTIRSTMRSANFQVAEGANPGIGWEIKDNGDVTFNEGAFRGNVDVHSLDIPDSTNPLSWHVDTTGNMWWGNSLTYAGASIKISNAGAAFLSGATITGNITATTLSANSGGTIGGFTIGPSSLTGTNIKLESTGIITAGNFSGQRIEMNGSVGTLIFYQPSGTKVGAMTGDVFVGTSGSTTGIVFSDSVATLTAALDLGAGDFVLYKLGASFAVKTLGGFTAGGGYLFSDLGANTWGFVNNGIPNVVATKGRIVPLTDGAYNLGGLDGVNPGVKHWDTVHANFISGSSGTNFVALAVPGLIGFSQTITGTTTLTKDLGTTGIQWRDVYARKFIGNSGTNVMDFSISSRIVTNQDFMPDGDGTRTSGRFDRRWSDIRTVLYNGSSFLSGTKVYFVANSSGGATTRKLTFINGILNSET